MVDFTDVLGVDELADGMMTEVEVGGEGLMLAHVGDQFFASQSRCPHLNGRLAHGRLEGAIVTCPRHGSQFDLTDGHVVRWTDFTGVVETLAEALRHPRPLRTYETRVEDGRVQVGPQKPLPVSATTPPTA